MTLLYRIMDAMSGAMLVALVYYVCRLLIVRDEQSRKSRYWAAALLAVVLLQAAVGFVVDEEFMQSIRLWERVSMWIDTLAGLLSLGLLAVVIRNRHLLPRRSILWISGLLVGQVVLYVQCAVWRFADWTYAVYLPLSAVLWGGLGYIVDGMQIAVPQAVLERQAVESEWAARLRELLLRDRLFAREDLTRDEVCRLLLTNRTSLTQHLYEETGVTFSEFLREIRLEEAARLLRETDMPIDQVAFDVGLRSASGFHRNFLLSYGMTPRQYREQQK